jgi:hypothetical protein
VQGGEHAHGSRRAAVHRFAAGDPEDLPLADSVLAQHAGAFRRADDDSPSRASDGGRAVEVIPVGVANEHEIGPLHLRGRKADWIQARQPVQVAVEEQVETRPADPERSGPEPLDGPATSRSQRHGATLLRLPRARHGYPPA